MLTTYYGDSPLITTTPAMEHKSLPRTPRTEVVSFMLGELEQLSKVRLRRPNRDADVRRGTGPQSPHPALRGQPLLNPGHDDQKWRDAADAGPRRDGLRFGLRTLHRPGPDRFGLPQSLPRKRREQFRMYFQRTVHEPEQAGALVRTDCPPIRGRWRRCATSSTSTATATAMPALPVNSGSIPRKSTRASAPRSSTRAASSWARRSRRRSSSKPDARSKSTRSTTNTRLRPPRKASGDTESPIDYMILRYADILLMYAEAKND